MPQPSDNAATDTEHKLTDDPLFRANSIGGASLACNLPFIIYALINPDTCSPDSAFWSYIGVGFLVLGLILAVIATCIGSKRWAFAAIAPPVAFIGGAAYLLTHIKRVSC